jgi:chitinase
MKKQNPELITILAIGGWNEGSDKYKRMVETEENRQIFVESVVQFLQYYNFSGLEFDWV